MNIRTKECQEEITNLTKKYGMELVLQCLINHTNNINIHNEDYLNSLVYDLEFSLGHYKNRYL